MKNFIVIALTLIIVVSWSFPFIIYHLVQDSRGFAAFIVPVFLTGFWLVWVDDRWRDL